MFIVFPIKGGQSAKHPACLSHPVINMAASLQVNGAFSKSKKKTIVEELFVFLKKNAHKVPAHQGESSAFLALHPDYTPGSAETWVKVGVLAGGWAEGNSRPTGKERSSWGSCLLLPTPPSPTHPTPPTWQEISNHLVLTGTCWTLAISTLEPTKSWITSNLKLTLSLSGLFAKRRQFRTFQRVDFPSRMKDGVLLVRTCVGDCAFNSRECKICWEYW